MAVKWVKVQEYRCDGCSNAVWAPEGDTPTGFAGAVTFADGNLGGEFTFFACKRTHVNRAVKNALSAFVENGKAADAPPESTPENDGPTESATEAPTSDTPEAGEPTGEVVAVDGEPTPQNVESADAPESGKPRSRGRNR